MTEPSAASGWLAVSRALDAVAYVIEPDHGFAGAGGSSDELIETVVALAGYAAEWLRQSSPGVDDAELAASLRATAGQIREVESIDRE